MKNTWLQKNLHFYYSDVRICYSTQCVTRTRIYRKTSRRRRFRQSARDFALLHSLLSSPLLPQAAGKWEPLPPADPERSGNTITNYRRTRPRRAATFLAAPHSVTSFFITSSLNIAYRLDNHFAVLSKRKCGIRADIKNSCALNSDISPHLRLCSTRWLYAAIGDIERVNPSIWIEIPRKKRTVWHSPFIPNAKCVTSVHIAYRDESSDGPGLVGLLKIGEDRRADANSTTIVGFAI